MEEGYNVADYLLEIASEGVDTGVGTAYNSRANKGALGSSRLRSRGVEEARSSAEDSEKSTNGRGDGADEFGVGGSRPGGSARGRGGRKYAATFLTQVEVLCGREWKNLKRYVLLFC